MFYCLTDSNEVGALRCSLNALHPIGYCRVLSFRLCCALLRLALPAWSEDSAYTIRGFDARIQRGIDLIYNLRFAEAERHFQDIVAAEPDNPLGYFFRAMVSWWRILIDLPDKTHDAEFHARLKQCIEVCDPAAKKRPDGLRRDSLQGRCHWFPRAACTATESKYVKAAHDGLRSLPLLKKSRQLEPTNKDILFGQGLYHYFAEVMPQRHRILRPIMAFLPDGDRVLGLQQLKEVAREGAYARTEAAYFLGQIYRIFEKDNRRALPYFEELYKRYPDNAVFHRYTARLMVELGRWRSGVALYEEYVRRSLAGQTGYHRHGRLEAHYYAGKYAYFERRFPEAADHLAATDSLAANSERKRDPSFCRAGQPTARPSTRPSGPPRGRGASLPASAALARPRGQPPTGETLSARALPRGRRGGQSCPSNRMTSSWYTRIRSECIR